MFNQSTKRYTLLYFVLCFALLLQAQIPTDYYKNAKGTKGSGLKTALYQKIASHTQLSYSALWQAFKTTDVRSDGKIWDMYSNATNYVPGGSAQGANYKKEGDSYNREHSFPKSWFNDAYPMYTDLFHLYPTDGYVNNRRSNYPFGETDGGTYTSSGDFSKLGKSTLKGYSGTVFEPADEYKGDFARSYFYMATAYEDKIAGWHSDMLAGNSYPAYTDWAIEMLLRWAQEDPVSQKEIDRNNAVYKLQGNRNPYIDYPGLEQYVWGGKTTTAFDPDNYDGKVDPTPDPTPDPVEISAPEFSPVSGVVAKGTEVTISTSTEGAYVYYTVNNGDLQCAYSSATVAINANSTIVAYAQMGETKSEEVTAVYKLASDAPVGENVYTLISTTSELAADFNYLIVANDTKKACTVALSAANEASDIRQNVSVDKNDDQTISTEVGGADQPYALTLGGKEGEWTLYDAVGKTYLALSTDGNKLHSIASANESAQWSINFSSEGNAVITSNKYSNRCIEYNMSSPRFACYKASQQKVYLYKSATATTITQIEKAHNGQVSVFTTNGTLIRTATSFKKATQNLPAGIYLINGKKVLLK